MVKIIGAVMTAFACGYFGFKMSRNLKTRLKSLIDIGASLEMLETEINFSMQRLKKAFISADRNGLFTAASELMEDRGIKESWRQAVEENSPRLCLTESDEEILLMLGSNIGKTDTENQIKNIRYIKAMIKEQEKQAENEYNRLGNLYRSGGVLAGIMIVIILI